MPMVSFQSPCVGHGRRRSARRGRDAAAAPPSERTMANRFGSPPISGAPGHRGAACMVNTDVHGCHRRPLREMPGRVSPARSGCGAGSCRTTFSSQHPPSVRGSRRCARFTLDIYACRVHLSWSFAETVLEAIVHIGDFRERLRDSCGGDGGRARARASQSEGGPEGEAGGTSKPRAGKPGTRADFSASCSTVGLPDVVRAKLAIDCNLSTRYFFLAPFDPGGSVNTKPLSWEHERQKTGSSPFRADSTSRSHPNREVQATEPEECRRLEAGDAPEAPAALLADRITELRPSGMALAAFRENRSRTLPRPVRTAPATVSISAMLGSVIVVRSPQRACYEASSEGIQYSA